MKPLPNRIVIDSPAGRLGIGMRDNHITHLDFTLEATTAINPSDVLAKKVIKQLNNYFTNPKHVFDLPLQLHGTPFQQRVWDALRTIPVGHTMSYGELAKILMTSARAIGNACRTNPIAIIVPCHRILGSNSLGGYGGKTTGSSLTTKEWLLKHEGALT